VRVGLPVGDAVGVGVTVGVGVVLEVHFGQGSHAEASIRAAAAMITRRYAILPRDTRLLRSVICSEMPRGTVQHHTPRLQLPTDDRIETLLETLR
jgi:hypothetical protein